MICQLTKKTTGEGMIVARYKADGSLDTNFGTNGWSTVTFGAQTETPVALDIQPDGKIVVGGTIRNVVNNQPFNEFAIARLNTDGSLDTTFDGDGKITIDFNDLISSFYTEVLGTLKVGSDGKIVAAGQALNSGVDDRFVLAKINPNGSLDSSFGTNGKLADVSNGASNMDYLNDMVILPDGKFVVVGRLLNIGGNYRLAIKYNLSGGRDWTYAQGSTVVGDHDSLNGIAVLPNGKFIVVGKRLNKVVALRLNADGSEDTTFISAAGMPDGRSSSVAVQVDGKIVATIDGSSFSLVRYNADGSLDGSFSSGGFVTTSVSGGVDLAKKVLIQPDRKILVGGSSQLSSPTRNYFSIVRYMGAFAVPNRPLFDYDGDGRADVSVFRPSENKWYILQSSNWAVVQTVFAMPGDIPAPADFDGDGKTDLAVFRPSSGDWWYLSSIKNAQVFTHWGQTGDVPRPGDFDGDGKTDFVVYRPSNSVWYRFGSTGAVSIIAFGIAEDKPLVGDFDGDGKSDLAVYRPSTGDWWYASSLSAGQYPAVHWGQTGDIPAPADYDGDGKTDFAVYRPSNGGWYISRSNDQNYTILPFGLIDDKPVPADFDGDGKADIAVFRPSTGVWYLQQSTTGFSAVQWGLVSDIPTENAFVP